jgi:hypothetical protein
LVLFFCLHLSASVYAQYYNLPNDVLFNSRVEKQLSKRDSIIHSGMQPYVPFFDAAYTNSPDTNLSKKTGKWLKDVLFHKHFIDLSKPKEQFTLRIDPILNVEGGRDLSDTAGLNLYTNTRGIIGAGTIGSRFYFETMFAENQSVFPTYLANATASAQVVPGQGRWKNFKLRGYDYAFSSGCISFQARKNINVQVGHGKQKIGYGYRSLLLSDNSFNYPYLRVTQQWFKGKLQYTNIYAVLMNLVSASAVINPNAERLYQKKCASFQYLSFNPTKFLNLGLFQGLIWQAADSRNRQHLTWHYFNPLIYSNILNFGLDNQNNIVVGADARLKLSDRFNLYGQYMLDHFKETATETDRYGYQLGFRSVESFGLKGLSLQGEWNQVRSGSYTSPLAMGSDQSYSHYGQTLAYTPLEGTELTGALNYQYKRFFLVGRLNYQQHLKGQTNQNTVQIMNGRAGFIINPAYNLQLSGGLLVRTQNFHNFKGLNSQTTYFYLSVRTSLYNLYYDF